MKLVNLVRDVIGTLKIFCEMAKYSLKHKSEEK